MPHPYVGLRATFLDHPGSVKVTGTIVAIGVASEECSGYSLHFTSAVLLLADGTHRERALDGIVVDPTEAARRLGAKEQ